MNLVLRFDGAAVAALGHLRASHEWEVLVDGDRFWARAADTPGNRAEAACLPADARYFEKEADLLSPMDGELPVGPVPAGEWGSVADLLEPKRALALWSGIATAAVPIELTLAGEAKAAGALLLRWDAFAGWARGAPAVRLARLRIAVSASGLVFARGTPLPPLPGKGYYWDGPLAIPCGHALAAHLWPELIAERLALRPGDTAMLHSDGSIDVITDENWSELSRSSIELTCRARRTTQPV